MSAPAQPRAGFGKVVGASVIGRCVRTGCACSGPGGLA